MTKQEFINKYIYGIGNDALTDNQEAIDMSNDLDKYVTEQLRQYNVAGRSELLLAFIEHIKKDNELTQTVNANDVEAFLKSQQ